MGIAMVLIWVIATTSPDLPGSVGFKFEARPEGCAR